ncbi:MAG TPA: hypothetical protein VM686_12115, partial [Polyangiaceae bacterium]|nr:hypothetical protein [Polyangiaceae bacterium]
MSAKLPASSRSRPERRDPLAAIFALGRRQLRTGAMFGVAGTLFVHGAGAGQAVNSMHHVHEFVMGVREQVRNRMRLEVDIDVTPPPPPEPEPEKEPEPEPEPEAKPIAKEPPPTPEAPPPAAAQAGQVL